MVSYNFAGSSIANFRATYFNFQSLLVILWCSQVGLVDSGFSKRGFSPLVMVTGKFCSSDRSISFFSLGVCRAARWVVFLCDHAGPGTAVKGHNASWLASFQGIEFDWNIGRQSGAKLNLPEMRNCPESWTVFSCQVLSLEAIELHRDLGTLWREPGACGTLCPTLKFQYDSTWAKFILQTYFVWPDHLN